MNCNWNTPAKFVESARHVMGGIDCDPATNELAQLTVKASVFYTANGELQPWSGSVYCNPPYDRRINLFVAKLLAELDAGNVQQAVFMSNSKTDTRWWQALAHRACSVCFVASRIKSNGSKNSPLCGHTFQYFGANADGFAEEFGQYGLILRRDLEVGKGA